jgi:hypothetical protein
MADRFGVDSIPMIHHQPFINGLFRKTQGGKGGDQPLTINQSLCGGYVGSSALLTMLRAGGRWNTVQAAQNTDIRSRLLSAAMAPTGQSAAAAAVPINLVGEPNQNQNTGLAPAVPNANMGIMDDTTSTNT